MRNTKTWDYPAVTKEAEKQITQLMTKSQQVSDPKEAAMLRNWAYGVFHLWDHLTLGWRNEGDGERMEALTRR